MKYKLYFKINCKTKFLKDFSDYDTAFDYMRTQIKTKSNIECHYIRIHKRDNEFILDYGAHNALYIIKEV